MSPEVNEYPPCVDEYHAFIGVPPRVRTMPSIPNSLARIRYSLLYHLTLLTWMMLPDPLLYTKERTTSLQSPETSTPQRANPKAFHRDVSGTPLYSSYRKCLPVFIFPDTRYLSLCYTRRIIRTIVCGKNISCVWPACTPFAPY